METMKQFVGKRVRELRKRAGFKTIESLAEAMQVHPNSVGEIERGANWISPEMLPRLSRVLGVRAGAFFESDSPEKNPTVEALLEIVQSQERRIVALESRSELSPRVREVIAILREVDQSQASMLIEQMRASVALYSAIQEEKADKVKHK